MKHRKLHQRFLIPNARRGDGLGYDSRPQRILNGTLAHVDEPATIEKIATRTAMCDEPECLTEEEWKAHVDKRSKTLAEQQQKFEDAQRERARRLLTFQERLDAVVVEAKAARSRVDISRDLRLLRHMQAAGKSVRHLEQRLFAIERKVHSKPDAEAA